MKHLYNKNIQLPTIIHPLKKNVKMLKKIPTVPHNKNHNPLPKKSLITQHKNATTKVSRNLSRRMTKRQKQKLIMDSEFDEFEDFNEDEKMANKNINNKKNDVVDNEYSGKVKGDGGNIGVDIGYSNNSKVGNSDVDEKVSRDNNG